MACNDGAYKCDTSQLAEGTLTELSPIVSWVLRRKPRSFRSTGTSSDRSYAYDTVERSPTPAADRFVFWDGAPKDLHSVSFPSPFFLDSVVLW